MAERLPIRALAALARKEIYESWSGFALGLLAMGGFTALAAQSRLLPDAAIVFGGAGIGGVILALVVSMGVVAPERANGSITTLRALPVNPMLIMLVKMLVATGDIIITIALTALIFFTMAGERELLAADSIRVYVGSAVMSISLLAWMIAGNVRMRGEGAAGFVSLVLLLFLHLMIEAGHTLLPRAATVQLIRWLPWGAGNVTPHGWVAWLWPNVVMIAALWLVAAVRFSRVERSRG
jgi:ABC-type transport system involved in multi-copper enzyme maturation permease subunit